MNGKAWWRMVAATEPARLRAAWTAIIAVCAAVGVGVSQELDTAATAVIAAAAAILPLLQGEATRRKVSPAPGDGPLPDPDPAADIEIGDTQLAGDLADALRDDPGGE